MSAAFFLEHAGWSYDPKTETPEEGRAKGAHMLADAEQKAIDKGWYFQWERDEEPCIGCECGSQDCPCFTRAEHITLSCVLFDEPDGDVLASLGSICEPSRDYRRVVEAELALEALG